MQTKTLLAAAALVASAFADGENMKWQTSKAATTSQHHTWPAHNGTITTTKVVSKYTTWCPEPTTVCIGTKTYTVTKPTTLTITDCPCTITETHRANVTKVVPPPSPPPVKTTEAPHPPAQTTSAVVAGAEGRPLVYGFAMVVAGVVGAFAL